MTEDFILVFFWGGSLELLTTFSKLLIKTEDLCIWGEGSCRRTGEERREGKLKKKDVLYETRLNKKEKVKNKAK